MVGAAKLDRPMFVVIIVPVIVVNERDRRIGENSILSWVFSTKLVYGGKGIDKVGRATLNAIAKAMKGLKAWR